MRKTATDIARLESLLTASYTSAGKHLLSIHEPHWRMSALEICEELTGVCILDLATVSRDGAPLVSPVDGLFYKGEFWFSSSNDSARFRHIRREPRVSAAYTLGEKVSMVVHGAAREVDLASGHYDEVKRVMTSPGLMLMRLNAVDDVNFGAGQGVELEPGFYLNNGRTKRFFDKSAVESVLDQMQIKSLEHQTIDRYGKDKQVWVVHAVT